MFKGEPPFDDVTAIVVSHAHGDHFDAGDLARYLNAHSGVTLVAPAQAIATLTEDASLDVTASQLRAISLDFGAPPKSLTVGDLQIDSVRIAHAGWPQRRDIENLVFRVRFPAGTTVMHLGDADPNDQHFSPYAGHWKAVETQLAFPPYWFYLSPAGREILDQRIHAQTSVGVHVPVLVPPLLTKTDRDYFTRPGETREIGENSR